MSILSTLILSTQLFLLILGSMLLWRSHYKWAFSLLLCSGIGSVVLLVSYICLFHIPPFATMWHTITWFILLTIILTLLLWHSTKLNKIYYMGGIICIIFIINNLLSFRISPYTLTPALNSFWFVPHVLFYIIAYACLGICCVWSVHNIIRNTNISSPFTLCFNIGYFCLFCGLLIGCLWAKNIWGHYWSWDSKECFALISLLIYTMCKCSLHKPKHFYILHIIAFITLLFTWFGVKYLHLSQNLHIYG